MKAGFIGAGKMGFSLGKYLTSRGILLSGYFSRSEASAAEAAAWTGSVCYPSLRELAAASDLIFLTVPDREILPVWQELRSAGLSGKIVCHCSGALTSGVFAQIDRTGAMGCSLHPVYVVHDRRTAWKAFDRVSFTAEGEDRAVETLLALLTQTGNPVCRIAPEKKTLYHAACVTISNLVVGLAATGRKLFADCGLEPEFAGNAWRLLFAGNVNNICLHGPAGALTGPVERGDAQTVSHHLAALPEPERELYRLLSLALLPVAAEKHPGRDDTALWRVLI